MTDQTQIFLDRVAEDQAFRKHLRRRLDGLSDTPRRMAAVEFAREAGFHVTLDELNRALGGVGVQVSAAAGAKPDGLPW